MPRKAKPNPEAIAKTMTVAAKKRPRPQRRTIRAAAAAAAVQTNVTRQKTQRGLKDTATHVPAAGDADAAGVADAQTRITSTTTTLTNKAKTKAAKGKARRRRQQQQQQQQPRKRRKTQHHAPRVERHIHHSTTTSNNSMDNQTSCTNSSHEDNNQNLQTKKKEKKEEQLTMQQLQRQQQHQAPATHSQASSEDLEREEQLLKARFAQLREKKLQKKARLSQEILRKKAAARAKAKELTAKAARMAKKAKSFKTKAKQVLLQAGEEHHHEDEEEGELDTALTLTEEDEYGKPTPPTPERLKPKKKKKKVQNSSATTSVALPPLKKTKKQKEQQHPHQRSRKNGAAATAFAEMNTATPTAAKRARGSAAGYAAGDDDGSSASSSSASEESEDADSSDVDSDAEVSDSAPPSRKTVMTLVRCADPQLGCAADLFVERWPSQSHKVTAILNALSREQRLTMWSKPDRSKTGTKAVYYKVGLSKSDAEKMKGLDIKVQQVYHVVEREGNSGIWIRDIRRAVKGAPASINKALKVLVSRKLIKCEKSMAGRNKKVYMLYHLTPSREVTGGVWYDGHEFDLEFVKTLEKVCLGVIRKLEYGTANQVCNFLAEKKLFTVTVGSEDVGCILEALVHDGLLRRVPAVTRRRITARIDAKVESPEDSSDESDTLMGVRRSVADVTKEEHMYMVAPSLGRGAIGHAGGIPCMICPIKDTCFDGGKVNPQSCAYIDRWLCRDEDLF